MTASANIPRKLPSADKHPIRVMLVDDSQVARSIFSRLLSDGEDLVVVAEATDSAEAAARAEKKKQKKDFIMAHAFTVSLKVL